MTYATQADLIDRFGEEELAQRTNRVDGLTIDAVVLARALADADAEIDGYLATRYSLPLASVPAVLVRLGADMARYRLYDDGVPETVAQRYKDAVALLNRMAKGEVQVAGSALLPIAPGAGQAVAVQAPERVFGAAALQSY